MRPVVPRASLQAWSIASLPVSAGQVTSSRPGVVRASVLPTVGAPVRIVFHDRHGSKIEVRGTVRWNTTQLPSEEKAKPGFGIFIERGNEEFDEFFEHILTG